MRRVVAFWSKIRAFANPAVSCLGVFTCSSVSFIGLGSIEAARDNNEPLQRSLFDHVTEELNRYERSVALYLDHHPQVLWWYRNLIGAEYFSIQGYRRSKIYPDFIVQQGKNRRPLASVIVVESTGKQLKGNEDTNYKRTVAGYFGETGHKVPWQKLSQDFADQTFLGQVLDAGEYEDKDCKADLRRCWRNTHN